MKNCPCGSNINDTECCSIYINGEMRAETPEKLMRSRYTAYTQANFNYIVKTMKAPALNYFNTKAAQQLAATVQWLGLEIITSEMSNNKGYVEFIARFTKDGKEDYLHEISEFHQINGEWYYVDGKHKPKLTHIIKIGRNDPCYCGSGKKYKSCCLNKV